MDTHEFDPMSDASEGISRRDALKRGLRLTGAVLWATPVVQAIGMSPALAQATSPVPCETFESFRAKANWEDTEFVWDDSPGFGARDCTDCGGAPGVDGALYFSLVGDETSVTITLLNSECEITSIQHKAGRQCFVGTVAPDGNSATATIPAGGQDISHIEVCFRCCEVPTVN